MISLLKWILPVLVFSLIACGPKVITNTCENNTTCPLEQICKDAACVDIECSNNNECRGQYICNNTTKRCEKDTSTCKTNCCKDTDCLPKQQCKEGKCVVPPCTKDDDCTDTTLPKCLSGTCSKADACAKEEDCKDPTKPRCDAGTCAPIPTAKNGEKCEPNIPCETGLVCYSDIGQTFCRQPCDPFNAVCGAGTTCAYDKNNKGVCIPRNNGNKEGEQCESAPCEKNLKCVTWKDDKSTCAKPCRPKEKDCGQDDICFDFGSIHLCVPKPNECGPGRPCEKKWTCSKDGLCIPDICPHVPCSDGKLCRFGNCETPNCCKGDPCPEATTCNHANGQCAAPKIDVPFCTSCLPNGTCALPSETCLTLTSAADRFCAAECTVSKKCNDTSMTCLEQKNKRWFCVPLLGTCDRNRCKDVTCQKDEACLPISKKCVKIGLETCKPCENDIQCGGPTDLCIIKKGEKTGHCAQDCEGCATCPSGTSCKDHLGRKQCLPNNGTCPTP